MPESQIEEAQSGLIMAVSGQVEEIVDELHGILSPILAPLTDDEGKYDDSESDLLRRLRVIKDTLYDIRNRLQL